MLKQLLRIKVLREQGAALAVRRQRQRLELAVAEKTRREREQTDFRVWRPREEARLFAELVERLVPMTEIETYRETLRELMTREVALAHAVLTAEQDCTKARTVLTQAEQTHRAALKEVEKFEELNREAQVLIRREQERNEELELEEFATPTQRRLAA